MSPDEFIPFSLGHLVSLGESLALASLFLFISHIFQKYTVTLKGPDHTPAVVSGVEIAQAAVPPKIRFAKRYTWSLSRDMKVKIKGNITTHGGLGS